MSVSAELLMRAASETGFNPTALEKVVRLGLMAADVTRHPLLGKALALKGGTALNLCWGEPTRLSVDLDYNFVGERHREAMLAARPGIEGAVEELARRHGYQVQRSTDAFAGRKIYLGDAAFGGGPDRIEVDLNFLFRQPIAALEPRQLWQPAGLDRPRVRAVSLAELCIGKLLALLDRGAPRDAWDVARLPNLVGALLADATFRARFLAVAAILDHPLPTYSKERLARRLDSRTIQEQLIPMLVASERPSASALAAAAWNVVEPLVRLTPEEERFFDGIGKGVFHAELLGDPAALELGHHPAVAWKLLNVRRRLGRDS